jgi:F420H(2)-dependent quinone reductase
MDVFKIADKSWWLLGPLMQVHVALYRATGGRIGARIPGVRHMLLLDHVGAKSMRKRTTPLIYMPEGTSYLLAAAKGGHPGNPAWLYNLRAHPDTVIQIDSRRVEVRAREADAAERERLWPKAAAFNSHWRRYQRRTERVIPLVILEPR